MQVLGEHPDGGDVGAVGERAADLALQGREQQPVPGVRAGQGHLFGGSGRAAHVCRLHRGQGLLLRDLKADLQKALAFAPVHRQYAVRRDGAHGFAEVVVHAVDAVLLLGGAGLQHGLPVQKRPQGLAQRGVVADDLRQYVPRARERRVGIGHVLFGIDVPLRLRDGIALGRLHLQPRGQPLQPALPGDGGAGAALGPEGAVDVLQLRQRPRVRKLLLKLRGQHTLLGQRLFDLLTTLIQIAQVLQPLCKLPENLIVQRAGGLLAVAGDEGDGVPRVQ